MKHMIPTITVDTNTPAPKRAPNANPASPSFELPTAAIALNTSGAPLPNARNVTPYTREKVKVKDHISK
jgi:hypothetical protein